MKSARHKRTNVYDSAHMRSLEKPESETEKKMLGPGLGEGTHCRCSPLARSRPGFATFRLPPVGSAGGFGQQEAPAGVRRVEEAEGHHGRPGWAFSPSALPLPPTSRLRGGSGSPSGQPGYHMLRSLLVSLHLGRVLLSSSPQILHLRV